MKERVEPRSSQVQTLKEKTYNIPVTTSGEISYSPLALSAKKRFLFGALELGPLG